MRRLQSIETDQVQLEVCECDCGFHMGFDATYLDQVGDIAVICPSCMSQWNTGDVFPEDNAQTESCVKVKA